MPQAKTIRACGYVRTSSMTNVGGNSPRRQLAAIRRCAKHLGMQVLSGDVFSDPRVSGTDPVHDRKGFQQMLDYMTKKDLDTIIFEDSTRLARDLLVQELAIQSLTEHGFKLISAASPNQFTEESALGRMVRQILGAVAELDCSAMVQRLKLARDDKLKTTRAKTLKGLPTVVGKKSRLEGAEGKTIKLILLKWVVEPDLERGDLQNAARALTAKGIRTMHGQSMSVGQVTSWAKSLRAMRTSQGV